MTVSELIEKLKTYPQSLDIYIAFGEEDGCSIDRIDEMPCAIFLVTDEEV